MRAWQRWKMFHPAGAGAARLAGRPHQPPHARPPPLPPVDLYGGFGPADFQPFGGLSLGKRDGAFQDGAAVQTGSSTARVRGIVEFVTLRMAAGSWLWGRASNMMKTLVVRKLTAGAAAAAKEKNAREAAIAKDAGEQLAAVG